MTKVLETDGVHGMEARKPGRRRTYTAEQKRVQERTGLPPAYLPFHSKSEGATP